MLLLKEEVYFPGEIIYEAGDVNITNPKNSSIFLVKEGEVFILFIFIICHDLLLIYI